MTTRITATNGSLSLLSLAPTQAASYAGVSLTNDNLEVVGAFCPGVTLSAPSYINDSSLTLWSGGGGGVGCGAALDNTSRMTLSDSSSLTAGNLSGGGVITASLHSKVHLLSSASSATVQLNNGSSLTIGGEPYATAQPCGMSFLATIHMDATSTVVLDDVTATRELFANGVVEMFNGSTMVADLKISGMGGHLYAEQSSIGSAGILTLTAVNPGSGIALPGGH